MKLEEQELNQIAQQLQERIIINVVQDRPDQQLSLEQLMDKLNCGRSKVYEYVNQPDFPKYRTDDGKVWVYSDKMVDRWLEEKHWKL